MKGEILSPAGSLKSAIAAINSGCDAIYIGGSAFNARRFADSPSDTQLKEIINECHLRGVKVHITLNTLYKDNELNDVLAFASKMYSYGADAYIIQDLGFFSLIKKYLPDIAAHASTQLTVHSTAQAKAFSKLGFDRIVLSRELPLNEINSITKELDIETECFVHGALCVSYSGRCLMSSMLGGRSGNRGSCAQTCRMEYQLISDNKQYASGYLLSPKDNCMISHTKELLEADISSWKIEGRMKSPEYVALVTSLYRKYRDLPTPVTAEDMQRLTQIFNRGGELSTGYYYSHSGRKMLSSSPKSTGIYIGKVSAVKGNSCTIKLCQNLNCGDGIEIWTKGEHTGTNISKQGKSGDSITVAVKGKVQIGDKVYKSYDKALIDSLKDKYNTFTRRSRVKASLEAVLGAPLKLTLTTQDGVEIKCIGPVAEKAVNNPMSYADIANILSKTGGTAFILDFDNGNGTADNLYVPLSALKEFKRTACSMLEAAIISHFDRKANIIQPYTSVDTKKADRTKLSVQVYTKEQLDAALNISDIDIYCELNENNFKNIAYIADKAHSNNSRIFFALPVIERNDIHSIIAKYIAELENSQLDGYLVRNLTEIATSKPLIADYTLNTFNSASLAFLSKYFCRTTLSPELNLKELSPLCGKGTELVVYGRLPLMTTQQCPVGVHMANKTANKFCRLKNTHPKCILRDRKKAEFPVITMCDSCIALILNSAPIYVGDKWNDIDRLKSEAVRLIFTTEDSAEMLDVVNEHKALLLGTAQKFKRPNVTGGHFYRGVL